MSEQQSPQVAIVESVVVGVSAFKALCQCGWQCHKKPHAKQSVAVACGTNHLERKH